MPLERGEPRKHVVFDFGFVDFVEKLVPRAFILFDGKVLYTVFAVDRTEFLNRFDEIVLFRPLGKEELLQVVDLILAGVNKTLAPQKIQVAVEEEGKKLLVEAGYDPRLGARPMRRVVQRAVENTVAKQMLAGTVAPGSTTIITADQIRQILGSQSAQMSPGVQNPPLNS